MAILDPPFSIFGRQFPLFISARLVFWLSSSCDHLRLRAFFQKHGQLAQIFFLFLTFV